MIITDDSYEWDQSPFRYRSPVNSMYLGNVIGSLNKGEIKNKIQTITDDLKIDIEDVSQELIPQVMDLAYKYTALFEISRDVATAISKELGGAFLLDSGILDDPESVLL